MWLAGPACAFHDVLQDTTNADRIIHDHRGNRGHRIQSLRFLGLRCRNFFPATVEQIRRVEDRYDHAIAMNGRPQ